jgi:hypothetical protein
MPAGTTAKDGYVWPQTFVNCDEVVPPDCGKAYQVDTYHLQSKEDVDLLEQLKKSGLSKTSDDWPLNPRPYRAVYNDACETTPPPPPTTETTTIVPPPPGTSASTTTPALVTSTATTSKPPATRTRTHSSSLAPPTRTHRAPTTSPPPTPANTGAKVGGLLGGAALMLALGTGLVFLARRRPGRMH